MSLLTIRSKRNKKPVNPIVGYVEISVNSTPIVRKPVTATDKDSVVVEFTGMVAQMWKMFNVALSMSLCFCSEDKTDCDVILKFNR